MDVRSEPEELAPRSPPPRVSRSRLHSFSFPTVSWGTQKLLRCSKPTTGEEAPAKHRSPAPIRIRDYKDVEEENEQEPSSSAAAARPWNLRTRRAACNAPNKNPPSPTLSPFPLQLEKGSPSKLSQLRSEDSEKGKRREFSVSLSGEEIKEDFLFMMGTKPRRRPKKRPRPVQRQLDSLFPGLSLSGKTLDSYETDY